MQTSSGGLTEAQAQLLPTEQDVQFYREHGFWISPVIIPDDVLDAADRGMQRYYAGDLDSLGVHPQGWTPAPGDGLRKDDYSSLCMNELADLVRYPMIGATAGRLSGSDGIRLWHDQLLYKPADTSEGKINVGWHTDRQYWQCCSSADMLTAWVAFHDVTPEGGSVGFFDGSHTWDVSGLDFFSQDLEGLEARVDDQGYPISIMPTTMKRGQVSFHHCRTVHGSGANRTSTPRRSIAIHLQPTSNRAFVRPDGTVADHANNALARQVDGLPDYTDPALFPMLWGDC